MFHSFSRAGAGTASVIHLRKIWSSRCLSAKVDTKTLANLRKETGHGISLCREALVENDNDLQAAQEWLREEATKRGLKKAEKLQQRTAGEGLIGVVLEGKHAAMVEVGFSGHCPKKQVNSDGCSEATSFRGNFNLPEFQSVHQIHARIIGTLARSNLG